MMQARTLLLVLWAVLFSVAGQLFLKSGAQHLAGHGRLGFLLAAFRDVHVLTGLVAWTASTMRRQSPYSSMMRTGSPARWKTQSLR